MISNKDRETIRELATRWMELASLPVMKERKRLWRAVHDLKAERPVILVEVGSVGGFLDESELVCENPVLRAAEQRMRMTIRQAEEVGDDIVVEPYYRLGWRMGMPDYGVPVTMHGATDPSMGYSFNFPIKSPEDIKKLIKREIGVNRKKSRFMHETLEEAMGDILPVKLDNYDPFAYEFDCGEYGDFGFAGNFFLGLTWQLYRFIGNESLLYWLYDHPDAIHEIMQYMLDDRIAMFGEFVLPYLAKLSSMFGLVYYGCCERLDDRLEMIVEAIPNLRSVSVSGWSNQKKVAEILGSNYVYSRKPVPAHLSGATPYWELAEKDMRETCEAAGGGNLEILLRDLYDVNGDIPRLRKWVDMTKAVFKM